MATPIYHPDYHQAAQSVGLWVLAGLVSLALNLLQFGIMPELIKENPKKRQGITPLPTIKVIPFKKKTPKPYQKELKKKTENEEPKKMTVPNLPIKKIEPIQLSNIPFKMNLKLPAIPELDSSPSIKMVSVSAPAVALRKTKKIFRIEEIDEPLIPLVRTPPIYPLRAKRNGVEGWVNVKFLVNETGEVERISIVEAVPKDTFEDSVLRSVATWRFLPGTIKGKPVKTRVSTMLKFKLE